MPEPNETILCSLFELERIRRLFAASTNRFSKDENLEDEDGEYYTNVIMDEGEPEGLGAIKRTVVYYTNESEDFGSLKSVEAEEHERGIIVRVESTSGIRRTNYSHESYGIWRRSIDDILNPQKASEQKSDSKIAGTKQHGPALSSASATAKQEPKDDALTAAFEMVNAPDRAVSFKAERFLPGGIENPRATFFSACYLQDDRHLYLGLASRFPAFRDIGKRNQGVLVVDMEKFVVVGKVFEQELGRVYAMATGKHLSVVGGSDGIMVGSRSDSSVVCYRVDGGVNAVAFRNDDEVVLAGKSVLYLYDHRERDIYPVENFRMVTHVSSLATMPDITAIGRNVDLGEETVTAPPIALLPGNDPEPALKLKEYLTKRNIRYVRQVRYWKGWLLIVTHKLSYAFRIADGMDCLIAPGGVVCAQNPSSLDEF
jgi:hypothetical protein